MVAMNEDRPSVLGVAKRSSFIDSSSFPLLVGVVSLVRMVLARLRSSLSDPWGGGDLIIAPPKGENAFPRRPEGEKALPRMSMLVGGSLVEWGSSPSPWIRSSLFFFLSRLRKRNPPRNNPQQQSRPPADAPAIIPILAEEKGPT